jgi:hypothetical protein
VRFDIPKVVQMTHWMCDICEVVTDDNTGCCGSRPIMQCTICGNEVCDECRNSYDYFHWWGDHPDRIIYCKCCSTIKEKHINAIKAAKGKFLNDDDEDEITYLDTVDEIIKQWVLEINNRREHEAQTD